MDADVPLFEKKTFIKLEDYKNITSFSDTIRKDTKKLQSQIKNFDDSRTDFKNRFSKYENSIENIERKLNLLDSKFEG